MENRGISLKRTTREISIQKGGFFKPLMTTAFTLMKNVLTQFANSILVPLGLVAAASATYVAIQKKIFGSGTTVLIISGEEIDDITNLV